MRPKTTYDDGDDIEHLVDPMNVETSPWTILKKGGDKEGEGTHTHIQGE